MNMHTEINAVVRRYDNSEYFSVYDVIDQIRIFIRRYGGSACAYYSGHTKHPTIYVEYSCKVFDEFEKAQSYHYITLKLKKKIRNIQQADLIVEEIRDAAKKAKGLVAKIETPEEILDTVDEPD